MRAGTAKPRSEKKIPEFMRSFGWCTWDAFYSQVSAQGSVLQDVSCSHSSNAKSMAAQAGWGLLPQDGTQDTGGTMLCRQEGCEAIVM